MALLSPWCQSKTLHTTSQTRPPSPSPSADTVRTLSQLSVLMFPSELPHLISSETFFRRARSRLPYSCERFVFIAPRGSLASIFPLKMRTRTRIVSSCLDFKKLADLMFFTILCDDFVLFSEHFGCLCK